MEPNSLRLVVGLGNPGAEYAGTRHNIGFDAVDFFIKQRNARFEERRDWRCLLARAGELFVMKPLTYMNLSGQAFSAVTRFFKINPSDCLVVFDDVALPLGRLRLRSSGSAGGHNGLQSILDHAGGQPVPRLRIGVGAAPGAGQLVGHVLGRFASGERSLAESAVMKAAEAIQHIFDRGLNAAMNIYNKPEPVN